MKYLGRAGLLAVALFSFASQAKLLDPLTNPKSASLHAKSEMAQSGFSNSAELYTFDPLFFFEESFSDETKPISKSQLKFELFNDSIIDVAVSKQYVRHDGKTVWLGKVTGEPNSAANFIATDKQLTGFIRTKGKLYQISTQADGSILVNDFKPPKFAQMDVKTPEKPAPEIRSKNVDSTNARRNKDLPLYSSLANGFEDTADIKVLVYYTDKAIERFPDLLDSIDLEFIDTNQSFANSNIDAKLSIVAKIEIKQEPIWSSPFSFLSGRRGPFANLDAVRQKYKADLVHLYPTYLKNACGKAFLAAYEDGGVTPRNGLAATGDWCIGALITAHEIGHNLGAKHDRYVTTNTSSRSSYGFSNIDAQFRTVMAYDDQCDDLELDCERIPHFSNPDVDYNNGITGIALPSDEAADNAGMLNYSALSVANFKGVSRPNITHISQGDKDSISLYWEGVEGATSYVVSRTQYNKAKGELDCDDTTNTSIFTVDADQLTYTDTNVIIDVQTYCYSLHAVNGNLLQGAESPESFVRSGFASTGEYISMPFIEDILIENGSEAYSHSLTLPNSEFDYTVSLVKYNNITPPEIDFSNQGDGLFELSLGANIQNQTLILRLNATHKTSGLLEQQQFHVFVMGIENQLPELDAPESISVDQQDSIDVIFSITDEADIDEEAFYIYSTDEDIIEEPEFSHLGDGQFSVTIAHKGLELGTVELIYGYSDGELSAESTMTVDVKRTVFTPTDVQDITWYVRPGETTTRLLPFSDRDFFEELSVNMIEQPSQGNLNWPMTDKVQYTANENFDQDSFSFSVTDDYGNVSKVAKVIIKLAEPASLAPTQKYVGSTDSSLFLTHEGRLYAWGMNLYGSLGLGESYTSNREVFEPVEVGGYDWVDVAFHERAIWAIKRDGTLWFSGRINLLEPDRQTDNFTRYGEDTDWRNISNNGLFLKADGSVWGFGLNDNQSYSNRPEFENDKPITQIEQLIPLYNVTEIHHSGTVGFAKTTEGQYWSWGSNLRSDMARDEKSGYLIPISFDKEISRFNPQIHRGTLLSENILYLWGGGPESSFFGNSGPYLVPTNLDNNKWLDVATSPIHTVGIQEDGSLWSWGGSKEFDGSFSLNSYLGQGAYAGRDIAQVGDATNWIKVWLADEVTYALDDQGQIWVAGGDERSSYMNNGLPEGTGWVAEMTKVEGIAPSVTGTGDFDGDDLRDYEDLDDDNDGVPDAIDLDRLNAEITLDSDGDGIDNTIDSDDDNDGVEDALDALPLNPAESKDYDGDGIGDNADLDDDADGLSDETETALGLDPLNHMDLGDDSDADGYINSLEYLAGSDLFDAESTPLSMQAFASFEHLENFKRITSRNATADATDGTVHGLQYLAGPSSEQTADSAEVIFEGTTREGMVVFAYAGDLALLTATVDGVVIEPQSLKLSANPYAESFEWLQFPVSAGLHSIEWRLERPTAESSLPAAKLDALMLPAAPQGSDVIRDFNGDGKADIVWRNGKTGQNNVWLMDGATRLENQPLKTVDDTNWVIAGSGDFNADGYTDLLWRNPKSGSNRAWLYEQGERTANNRLDSVTDLNWRIAAVGDLNGDGSDDILWRHKVSGANTVWIMKSGSVQNKRALPKRTNTNWIVKGLGDLDGNGVDDILWQDKVSGSTAYWLLNADGVTVKSKLQETSSTDWQIEAVDDFNADGFDDIAWRNQVNGNSRIWHANANLSFNKGLTETFSNTDWQVAGSADFDGNGYADLLWRNYNIGNNVIFLFSEDGQIQRVRIDDENDFDNQVIRK